MAKTTLIFILVGIIVVGAAAIVGTLLLIRHKMKETRRKDISKLETEKNMIISPEILSELSQVEALINNAYLAKKFKDWNKRFDDIKENELPKLTDKILELEVLLESNNFKELDLLYPKYELEVYYLKTKIDYLVEEIREMLPKMITRK